MNIQHFQRGQFNSYRKNILLFHNINEQIDGMEVLPKPNLKVLLIDM